MVPPRHFSKYILHRIHTRRPSCADRTGVWNLLRDGSKRYTRKWCRGMMQVKCGLPCFISGGVQCLLASSPATEGAAKSSTMTTKVRSSKFRHIVGTPMQLRDTYGDILPGSCHSESTIIKANAHFFAMPWAPKGRYEAMDQAQQDIECAVNCAQGSPHSRGNSVCIVPLSKVGTVPEETPLVYYTDGEGDKVRRARDWLVDACLQWSARHRTHVEPSAK